MSTLTTLPRVDKEVEREDRTTLDPLWVTIGYNNDVTTFDEVIRTLQRVCGYSLEKAEAIAWEIHTKGKAVCYCGQRERCEVVASALHSIGVEAVVAPA